MRRVILTAVLASLMIGCHAAPASVPRRPTAATDDAAEGPVAPPPTSVWHIPEGGAVYAGVVEEVAPYDSPCHVGTSLSVRPALVLRGAESHEARSVLDVATKAGAADDCAKVSLRALHPSTNAQLGRARRWRVGQVLLFVEEVSNLHTGVSTWHRRASLAGAGDVAEVVGVAKQIGPSESGFVPMATPSVWKAAAEVAIDEATGLMWQRGMAPEPLQYAMADRYCRDLALGGFDDWRLPRFGELVGLADHGRTEPALDIAVFGAEPKDALLWGDEDGFEPWAMTLSDGVVHSTHYDDPGPYGTYGTRCVRAHRAPALASTKRRARHRIDGDTVTDVLEGRMWQRRMGSETMPRTEALAHCAKSRTGGHADWRLPTIEELLSLTAAPDGSVEGPEDGEGVWSSTAVADDAGLTARSLGSTGHWAELHGEPLHAICVRDAPIERTTAGTVMSRYPSGDVYATGRTDHHERAGVWRYYRDGGGLWLVERYADGRLAGPSELFFDNGVVMQRVSHRGGAIEGPMTSFWSSGAKRAVTPIVEGRAHGERRSFDEQGRLAAVEPLVKGQLHGRATSYDEGQKYLEEHWVAGKRHGLATTYYDSGKVRSTTHYRDGLLHGGFRELAENGKVVASGAYLDDLRDGPWRGTHENGKRAFEGSFQRGTGTMTRFDESGKRIGRDAYVKGKRHGTSERWYPSGKLRERAHWDQDAPTGLFESWYENGALEAKGAYAQGEKTGVWTRWYENGIKSEEATHGQPLNLVQDWDDEGRLSRRGHRDRAGELHGVWIEYYEGKRRIEAYYEHGVIVRPTRYHE